MASLVRRARHGCICCSVQLWTQVRHMSKLNTRKPRPRTISRRIFDTVTEPIVYRPPVPISETCGKVVWSKAKQEVNPYEEFLKRNCKKFLEENKFIAICHKQPIKEQQIRAYQIKLEPKGFNIVKWPSNKLLRELVIGTKYESLTPLLQSHNIYITSDEPDLKKLFTLTRRMPEIIIMGALYENKLLSRDELMLISNKQNIEVLRGELVSILNMAAGGRTSSFLCSHQQTLARNIDQYVKQVREEGDKSVESGKSEESGRSDDSSSDSDSDSSSDSDSD